MKHVIWVALFFIVLCFCMGCSAANAAEPIVQPIPSATQSAQPTKKPTADDLYFSMPEDAITHLVNSLKSGETEQAMGACALHTFNYHYNYETFAARTGAITHASGNAPGEHALYEDLNAQMRSGELSRQMLLFCYSFFVEGNLNEPQKVETEREVRQFVETVNPAQLRELEIVRIDEPYPDLLYEDVAQEMFEKQAEALGADEMTERIVLYRLNGKHYAGGFALLRYGNQWLVYRFNSIIANQNGYGGVQPTREGAYLQMTIS